MSTNKKLSQKDLRELMRQRKSVLSQNVTKIESPLAKYDGNGLCCVLCNVRIENQTIEKWSDHITGVLHKNKLEQMKRKKQLQTQSSDDNTKDRLTSNETREIKSAPKRKSDSVNNENSVLSSKVLKTNSEHKINNDMKSETRVNTDIVVKISNDIENQTHKKPNNSNNANNTSLVTTLPLDFFDNNNTDKEITENSDAKNKDLISSSDTSLPKGFFDNPLLDAKARHVQYKDPVDEEYEKFQKMISEETNVSQNIIEVDMEAIQNDRTIVEIDEQITNWSKVNELQNRAQVLLNSVKHDITKAVVNDDHSSEEEDEEMDVFTDWRNKRFLKS